MDNEKTAVCQQEAEAVEVTTEEVVREELFGEVVRLQGERAIVELFRKKSKKKSGKELDVLNPLSAKPGYVVKIVWQKIGKTRDNLMLVLPAVLSLVAGFIFSYNFVDYLYRRKPVVTEDVMLIGMTVWFLPGLYCSYRYWRYTYGRGSQPTVIDIVRK